MGFVVDKVSLGQFFYEYFGFPLSIPSHPPYLFIHLQLAVYSDTVIKQNSIKKTHISDSCNVHLTTAVRCVCVNKLLLHLHANNTQHNYTYSPKCCWQNLCVWQQPDLLCSISVGPVDFSNLCRSHTKTGGPGTDTCKWLAVQTFINAFINRVASSSGNMRKDSCTGNASFTEISLWASVEVQLRHDVLADGLTVNDAVSNTSDEMTRALRHMLQCLMCFCKCAHLQGASQNCNPSL